ncbi:recombinase family protein [Geomicrobium sediminis]|uniref:Site-specific DNA recombinase n=1 Tax=Geomicrobium sediminis TaxID=1347788 RepID=A0ABS2PFP7_9BACL|nr:recombinase family protein [Geomicrobium sediminis]MBM7633801.1 site-specific DNA recombinase [Geomicrobium sediminis]
MIALYIRVSTEEQSKHGYSIEGQIRDCQEKAKTKEAIEYIDDGVSGSVLDRPALSRLREDIKKGSISKVICYDPDRLSRKLVHQLIITEEIEKKASIEYVNGEFARTPEGMLFYQMRGAIAEFEKEKINERMSRGRLNKAKKGKVVKNGHMLGYSYDKENGMYVVNEEEAKIVQMIFSLFVSPPSHIKGMNSIAGYLNQMNIPTKRGKGIWHRNVVRQILYNETYTGVYHQNKWNTEDMLGNKYREAEDRVMISVRPKEDWITIEVPAIIDEQTFKYAQNKLQTIKRRSTKQGNRKYMLSGLCRCGKCGNTITGRYAKNWSKYRREYTCLKNSVGAKFPGCRPIMRIHADQLETEVWQRVEAYLNDPGEISATSEEDNLNVPNFEEENIARLNEEIEKLRSARKRLFELFSGDLDISTEEIREQLNANSQKEKELQIKLEDLEVRNEEYQSHQADEALFEEVASFYFEKQGDLKFEEKQEIMNKLIREIIIYEDRTEIITF